MPSEQSYELVYRPHAHQWDVHQAATGRYDVTWMCGGLGAGKTYELAQWLYDMATYHCPGIDGLLVEPDYDTFDAVFMRTWRACFPGENYLWALEREPGSRSSVKNLVVYWPAKSGGRGRTTIFVRSAHNSQIVQKIDGLTTVGYWGLDEPARMLRGRQAFEKCIGRGRVPTPLGRNPGLMVGSPRGLGHWTCEVMGIETDHPPHGYTTGYETGKPGYFVRACRTTDNARYLGRGYADRMLVAYGEVFWQQECNASLIRAEGQIFPNWYPQVHVVPHEVAMQLWARVVRRRMGADFGWTNPRALLMAGITGDNELVVVDEWYQRRTQIEEQGVQAHRMAQQYGRAVVECDPSDPAAISKLQSGYEYQGQRYVVPAQAADNAWQDGIDTIRSLMLVQGVGRVDHPALPQRNRAGKPQLFVSERCGNLIREITGYVEEPIREGQTPREAAVGDDHAIDALRYLAQALTRTWTPTGTARPTI